MRRFVLSLESLADACLVIGMVILRTEERLREGPVVRSVLVAIGCRAHGNSVKGELRHGAAQASLKGQPMLMFRFLLSADLIDVG
nr:hypothetical protein Iba_chr08eCG6550 [Ipomoea batatas]